MFVSVFACLSGCLCGLLVVCVDCLVCVFVICLFCAFSRRVMFCLVVVCVFLVCFVCVRVCPCGCCSFARLFEIVFLFSSSLVCVFVWFLSCLMCVCLLV